MSLKLFLAFLLVPSLLQNLVNGASLKQEDGCGGVITRRGEIRYKVGKRTDPDELCVWTLVNSEYPYLSVDMTEEGFADNGDHVEIFYYINGSLHNPVPSGDPHCDGPILSNAGHSCHVPSALIFLVFRSNHVNHGTGFSIKIEPSGTLLQPSRNIYEPYTLPQEGNLSNYVDYSGGGFKSYKVISWSLVNPSEFVLYRFNVTPPCTSNSTNSTPPSPGLSIFQANQGSPSRLETVCGSISRPIRLILTPPNPRVSLSPLLIIYENGRRSYGWGDLKFYWNLDEPPSIWRPVKGCAARKGQGGSTTTFFSGLVLLLIAFRMNLHHSSAQSA